MKKKVYTLVVDNYFPELCALSLPNHEEYAKRIGADFEVIKVRKYPEWYPTYEKLQINELGKDNDWNIHIDADILVHPEFKDMTLSDRLTIRVYSTYDPAPYYQADRYFMRDGRRIGLASSFIVVPKACHDLWTPFETPYQEAVKGTCRPHGIDDYCFSRNLARFHLRWRHMDEPDKIHHLCTGGSDNKEVVLEEARKVLEQWNKK